VKNIANTHIDTAYEKYRRYLHQYSKSIADTIYSNTNTAILTTLYRMKQNQQCPVQRQGGPNVTNDIQFLYWPPLQTMLINADSIIHWHRSSTAKLACTL